MPSSLAGFVALLAIWQLPFTHFAFAQTTTSSGDISLCGVSDFWNSTVVPYSFNNNKWGDDGTGFSCMDIAGQGKSFSVSFQWRGDASTVKAFPYLKLDPERLPVQFWNVSALQFSGKWSMLVDGTENASPQQQAVAYDNTALKANVAIDMFLSDNRENSTGLNAPLEIMIWLWYVPSMLPLGHAESTPQTDVVEVSGVKFSLYHGFNAQGQHVFSWLAHQNVTSTNSDFSPLLKYIWNKGLLSGALYLGQIEFGTEVMHAGQNTTFKASDYNLKLYRNGDADAPRPKTTSTSSTSTTSTTTSVSSSTTSSVRVSPTIAALAPTASLSSAVKPETHSSPIYGSLLGLLVSMAMAGLAAFCI